MTDFLFTFIQNNNLRPLIEKCSRNNKRCFSFQWIKMDHFQRVVGKTNPIYGEYHKHPTTGRFVKDIIALFKSGRVSKSDADSYKTVLGAKNFTDFLSIRCEDDVSVSSVLKPAMRNSVIQFKTKTAASGEEKTKPPMTAHRIVTFADAASCLSNRNITEFVIENAVIGNMSFFLEMYANDYLKIMFKNCQIKSLTGLPKNVLEHLVFNNCKIEGFHIAPQLIQRVSFKGCEFDLTEPTQYLRLTTDIEIIGSSITNLNNLMPSESTIALKITVSATNIKTLIGFPASAPNLKELRIQKNAYLVSLKGMPSDLSDLQLLELTENLMLKNVHSLPPLPKLQTLNLSSGYFNSGSFPEMPRLLSLTVDSNDVAVFRMLPDCRFLMYLTATKMRGVLTSETFNGFLTLRYADLSGTSIKFDSQTSPTAFFNLLVFYNKKNFIIAESDTKKDYFQKAAAVYMSIGGPNQSYNDGIIYSSYLYCTSNLFTVIQSASEMDTSEYYNCWQYQYIINETDNEYYQLSLRYLNRIKQTAVVEDIRGILYSKYDEKFVLNNVCF
jgi:hypothetical protein